MGSSLSSSDQPISRLKSIARRIPGAAWMVGCAASFCGMGICVKILIGQYHVNVFHIGWLRFVIGALSMGLPALFGKWSLRVNNRPIFVCRGFFGSIGQFLAYVVIVYVGLGRGTVLVYLLGVVGAVSGIFILKERPSFATAVAICLGTIGVFLTCKTGVPHGVEWLALIAAFCSGVTLSFVRLLRRTDSNQVVFFSQGVFGMVLLLPFIWSGELPADVAVWGLILGAIALDIGGQLMMSQGLGMVPVAQGAALLMLTPVLSLLVGGLLLAEPLNLRQWLGCFTVLAGSYLAVLSREK